MSADKNPLDFLTPADAEYMLQTVRVTLTGSAKFEKEYHEWNEKLTFAGMVVYSLAVFPSTKGGEKSWYTEEQKQTLDLMHLTKIMHSDAVVVLNVGGYMGESTRREVMFAMQNKRNVFYLEGEPNVSQLIGRSAEISRGSPPVQPRDAEDFRSQEE